MLGFVVNRRKCNGKGGAEKVGRVVPGCTPEPFTASFSGRVPIGTHSPYPERIELTGFEPATSSSRTKRATSLRYSSMHLSRRQLYTQSTFWQEQSSKNLQKQVGFKTGKRQEMSVTPPPRSNECGQAFLANRTPWRKSGAFFSNLTSAILSGSLPRCFAALLRFARSWHSAYTRAKTHRRAPAFSDTFSTQNRPHDQTTSPCRHTLLRSRVQFPSSRGSSSLDRPAVLRTKFCTHAPLLPNGFLPLLVADDRSQGQGGCPCGY